MLRAGTRLRLVSAVVALVMGIVAAAMSTASPALAATYPGVCNKRIGTDGRAYAECTTGSENFRVGFACKYPVGYAFEVDGNWAWPRAGNRSVASCPWGSFTVTTYPWIGV